MRTNSNPSQTRSVLETVQSKTFRLSDKRPAFPGRRRTILNSQTARLCGSVCYPFYPALPPPGKCWRLSHPGPGKPPISSQPSVSSASKKGVKNVHCQYNGRPTTIALRRFRHNVDTSLTFFPTRVKQLKSVSNYIDRKGFSSLPGYPQAGQPLSE